MNPVLPPDALASLRLLADRQRFGSTVNEVARYLILRALDDLARDGQIPSGPIKPTDE